MVVAVVGLVGAVVLSACAGPSSTPVASPSAPSDTASTVVSPTPDASTAEPAAYFPLTPGSRYVYVGTVTDDEGSHDHSVTFTVTDLVAQVDQVTTRIVLDVDETLGEVTESELAFFHQDAAGNTWTYAEYPEEYEEGTLIGAPNTWVAGQSGATAGILVPAVPEPGVQFEQGKAPAVGFDDVGLVEEVGLSTCVPTGCYENAVRIKEWAPNAEADGFQYKVYAPAVGLVDVQVDGGESQEVMNLHEFTSIGAAEMEEVRAQAMELDARARESQPDYAAISDLAQG